MTTSPRVSIIMNVHNGAPYLREAIDSALGQSFPDWELIVWDDQSTDDSAAIVRSYDEPRVRYTLSDERTSLARARERAIGLARGDWLAFLDQDDIWLPEKLQRQMRIADQDDEAGLIYGRTVTFDAHGGERDFDHRHEFEALPEGNIFTALFEDSCFLSMSSAILKRTAVEALGSFPDSIEITPDYYLFVGVAHRHRARAVQDVVCRYRLHDDSITSLRIARIQQEMLSVVDQWGHHLDPALVCRRRRVHESVLAASELSSLRSVPRGIVRLLRDGSPVYVLSRPFAWGYRAARRRLRRPCWRQSDAMREHARIAVQ